MDNLEKAISYTIKKKTHQLKKVDFFLEEPLEEP